MNNIPQKRQQSVDQKPPKPKEKTAREKAMEFAKNNVPKPKVKPSTVKDDKGNIHEEEEDEVPEYLKGGKAVQKSEASEFLSMLDQRHQAYSDEVQKIKKTFGFNI